MGGASRKDASVAAYEIGRGSAGFLSIMDPGQPEETKLGGGHYSAHRPARRLGYQSHVYGSGGATGSVGDLYRVARRVRGANTIRLVDNIAARLMALL